MTTTPDQPLVSIVIPIYGVEEWLDACLLSVQEQTYRNFEAILVIDGSPDDSEAIARSIAETDDRFHVHVTENQGLGAARNHGVAQATGDLLTFLDSDDTLTRRAIGWLVEAMHGTDAELACGLAVDTYPEGRRKRYWTQLSAPQFKHLGTGTYTLADTPSLLDDHTAWAKLFRRDFYDRVGARFPVGVHCEDIVPILQLELAATAIAVMPLEAYEHRRHEEAISADYVRRRTLVDWLSQATITIDLVHAHGDARLTHHYVEKHTLRQWTTRIKRFTEFEPAAMEAAAELAAHMLGAVDGRLDAETPLLVNSLKFFARGGPAKKWTHLTVSPYQAVTIGAGDDELVISTEEQSSRAAVDACDALDLSDELEQRLAAELVLSRILQPIANGVLDDHEAESLLKEADRLIAAIGTETFGHVVRPRQPPIARPVRRSAAAAVDALDTLPARSAVAHAVTVDDRGMVLRGTAPSAGADATTKISARARQGGGDPFEVPVWTAPVVDDPDRIRWQAIVPASALDAPGSLDLCVEHPTLPAAQLPVGVADAVSDLPDPHWQILRRSPLRWATTPSAEPAAETTGVPSRASSMPARIASPRIFTYPDWRTNPYLSMLQLEVRGAGYALPGTTDLDALIAELTDPAATGIVHIQWPSLVTDLAKDDADAVARVDRLLAALDVSCHAGRPLIWTIHNALPHGSRFEATAVRLHQGLADAADLIHVLSPATLDVIGDAYTVDPAKVRLIEHSSYLGMYGSAIAPRDARAQLGVDPARRTVLFFGQLRPFKGLERLFAAVRRVQDVRPTHLLLAGQLVLAGQRAPELLRELAEIDGSEVGVTSAQRFIPDDEVATWFSAADVVVLPYRRVLNSGTTHLAATFGVPVVLPDEPALLTMFGDEPWVRFFDRDDDERSIAALVADDWYLDESVRTAATFFARRYSPVRMAQGYLDLVESL